MSSVSLIIILIALLVALVCYAYVYQTVQHKRAQKTRLLAALTGRSRSLKLMLGSCPEGFLPKELVLLVQHQLIEVLEQLGKLEPRKQQHVQDLQALNIQAAKTQGQATATGSPGLQSPQKIKEIKACLDELHHFICQLESHNSLARNQADTYRHQIKQLSVQVTVDGYTLSGNEASQNGKIKLAIHYFELAHSLLVREGRGAQVQNRTDQLHKTLKQLNAQLATEQTEAPVSENEEPLTERIANEWEKFDGGNKGWKKKNVYD